MQTENQVLTTQQKAFKTYLTKTLYKSVVYFTTAYKKSSPHPPGFSRKEARKLSSLVFYRHKKKVLAEWITVIKIVHRDLKKKMMAMHMRSVPEEGTVD